MFEVGIIKRISFIEVKSVILVPHAIKSMGNNKYLINILIFIDILCFLSNPLLLYYFLIAQDNPIAQNAAGAWLYYYSISHSTANLYKGRA